ncbi:MAG TPA: NAD(P)H-dependent oxidoreductase [Candidatus Saccharibacteria bacterium]|nr:NAD(P)H-dependent oxidoreductase [Candidatus Saccharibacteria bacterium]
MKISTEELQEALNWRAAIKKYDTTKVASEADLNLILEAGRMAPSSNGLEPWKFLIIEDTKVREQLRSAAHGQPQVTEASYFIVLAAETDKQKVANAAFARVAKSQNLSVDDQSLNGYKASINGMLAGMDKEAFTAFAKNQVFIALGFMLATAALAGIDANPMGGFDSSQFNKILNLSEQSLTSTVVMGIGVRDQADGYLKRPKFRKSLDEVVGRV